MPIGSTRGYYRPVNFDQNLMIGNRQTGVLSFGGMALFQSNVLVALPGGYRLRWLLLLDER